MDLGETEWSNFSLEDQEDPGFNAYQKHDESPLGSVGMNSHDGNSQGDEDLLGSEPMYDGYDSFNESGFSTDNDELNESLPDEDSFDGSSRISKYKFASHKDGMATCEHCGNVGVRHAFYSKSKRFCSLACSRSFATHQREENQKISPKPQIAVKKGKPSKKGNLKHQSSHARASYPDGQHVFDWGPYLMSTQAGAASVSCFKHVPMHDCWEQMVEGVLVEVPNTDIVSGRDVKVYWIATVLKIYGYKVLLRYEGFGSDGSKDFWSNLLSEDVHNVGWCATYGKMLAPPNSIKDKYSDWREFLIKRLTGTRTIPPHFHEKAHEWLDEHNIKPGMYLEVVNKLCVSAMRVALVKEVIGGRLHLYYVDSAEEDEFWCHMSSTLIHPVGWSQSVGHKLHATHDYITSCLSKSAMMRYGPKDTTPDMFPKYTEPPHGLAFQVGMKLEAIDPLNLSAICVATVMKVLRNNYLMIGIDGSMAENGSDWFCYHATSPCIFPVGFCEINNLILTPPREVIGPFKWFDYLRETGSMAAPVKLFDKDIPKHGFRPGMKVEAVDLMEPRLICVATVTKVVGRLLRIHFDGWEDNYDQWIDCRSPDIYPVGWCEAMKHNLEGPNTRLENQPVVSRKRKGKAQIYRGQRKKKSSMLERRSRDSVPKLFSPLLHQSALGSAPYTSAVTPTSATRGGLQEESRLPPHKMLSPEAVAATLPPLLEPDIESKPVTVKTEVTSPSKPPILSPHGRVMRQGFSQELADRLQVNSESPALPVPSNHASPPAISAASNLDSQGTDAAEFHQAAPSAVSAIKSEQRSDSVIALDLVRAVEVDGEDEESSGAEGMVLTLSSRLRALPLPRWSLRDVIDVLKVNGCSTYAGLFNKKEIDGARLQSLSVEDVKVMVTAVEGPVSRLCDLIQQVKLCTANISASS